MLGAAVTPFEPENPCGKFRPGAQAGAHIPAGTIPGRVGSGPEVESEEKWRDSGLTRHWSQLRPVTRRLQKQSPLTGSHWELPDTVPRWSQRQASGGAVQSKKSQSKCESKKFYLLLFIIIYLLLYLVLQRIKYSDHYYRCSTDINRLSGDWMQKQ